MIRVHHWLATAAVTAAVAALPAAAPAAVKGTTTLALNGQVVKDLREAGVGIAPLRPARGGKGKVVLPIAAGLAGAETTLLRHRGGLLFRDPHGAKLRITKLRLRLGKHSRISARLGGREVDVFKVLGRHRDGIDAAAGTVAVAGLRLRLTRAGAQVIAAELAPEAKPGGFATLSVHASGLVTSGEVAGTGESGAAAASGCALPSGAGPAPEDPLPVADRPPAASDIASGTIGWHVRESFIRYVASGEGTSVSGGASADPPVLLPGASAPLAYDFHFPFASGWHDSGANPTDPSDDRAAIYFNGAVRFLYSAHEIDLSTAAPEIEIAGGTSRAIFAVSEKGAVSSRQVLVNLDLTRAGGVAVNGNTYTYERVPGAVPAGTASSVFGGFYAPGTEFGCFKFTYTTS